MEQSFRLKKKIGKTANQANGQQKMEQMKKNNKKLSLNLFRMLKFHWK
jgi:hypothetical protein